MKHRFKWIGGNGFIDMNVSGMKMKGEDITVNNEPLMIRKPYANGDIVEFDNDKLAFMLQGNGNWSCVSNTDFSTNY